VSAISYVTISLINTTVMSNLKIDVLSSNRGENHQPTLHILHKQNLLLHTAEVRVVATLSFLWQNIFKSRTHPLLKKRQDGIFKIITDTNLEYSG
jgi:hypothetical protein